ncbi:MAG TPA: hypothetical protein DCY57_00320 [Bacteroidetes bacterium]|nr:hypothetical protein [Bacteroidota bacterium]
MSAVRTRFFLILTYTLAVLTLTACSVFSTREPEDPLAESGTFDQPDTPEQVIDNIQFSIAELNTLNYRRSLSESFTFRPSASAQARESVFASWTRSQEEQYFSALTAAAALNVGHVLALNDRSLTLVAPDEFVLDATYVLNINHSRAEVPKQVQGRLVWVLKQGSDGLWSILEWTDQELGSEPSWSDLKAEFMK